MNKWKWDLVKTVMVIVIVLGVLTLSLVSYVFYDNANYHNGRLTGQGTAFAARLAEETSSMAAAANNDLSDDQSDLQRQIADLKYLNRVLQESLREDENTVKNIEDWLLCREQLKAVTPLRLVIFVPSDVPAEWFSGEAAAAIERALKITQVWYQKELGVTFGLQNPVVVRGKNTADFYDNLKGEAALRTITNELEGSQTTIVFLASNKSSANWSGWGGWGNGLKCRAALIGLDWYNLFNGAPSRYETIALLVHELSHAWGLPHSLSGDDAAVMKVDETGAMTSACAFPLASFTEQEKNILRSNMSGYQ